MLPVDLKLAKVKRDPKSEKFEISLEADLNGGTLTGDYSSKAAPHPHLVVALQKLAGPFIEICELKGAATPDDIDVRTVSISYPSDGGRGVVITAVRTLKTGQTMTLNSPLVFCEFGEDHAEGDERGLPERTVKLIDRVVEEAQHFLSGAKRGQVEMFAGGDQEEGGWEDEGGAVNPGPDEPVGVGAGAELPDFGGDEDDNVPF